MTVFWRRDVDGLVIADRPYVAALVARILASRWELVFKGLLFCHSHQCKVVTPIRSQSGNR